MQHHHHEDLTVLEAAVRQAHGNEAARERDYRPPQLLVIGDAVDLLQGGYGGYSDWDQGSCCRSTP